MSSANKQILKLVISGLWLLCSAVALWFVADKRATVFDPNNMLQQPQWQRSILPVMADIDSEKHSTTLLLVGNEQCRCQRVAAPHQSKVIADARRAGIKVRQVDASSLPTGLLPAVPAAIMLAQGSVLYAGPLSVGLGCAIEDGIIDTVISNYENGYHSSMLVSKVSGCYCRV